MEEILKVIEVEERKKEKKRVDKKPRAIERKKKKRREERRKENTCATEKSVNQKVNTARSIIKIITVIMARANHKGEDSGKEK